MLQESKPTAHELKEHKAFFRTIDQFSGTLASAWRATVAQIVMIFVAIGAAPLLARNLSENRLVWMLVIYGFLLLLLGCNSYDLLQHYRLKGVRARLLDQLQIAIEQRVRADALYDLSILDSLTGLHNRRFGEERLQQEILRSERNLDPLTVILFDLDSFKAINDRFGHAAGDLALKEFSRRLTRAIRACDVPVRIGGDEFLVILPECPRDKINPIISRIGSPEFEFNSQKLPIGYSLGRAQYKAGDTVESLLGRADVALYAEKERRRRHAPPESAVTHAGVAAPVLWKSRTQRANTSEQSPRNSISRDLSERLSRPAANTRQFPIFDCACDLA